MCLHPKWARTPPLCPTMISEGCYRGGAGRLPGSRELWKGVPRAASVTGAWFSFHDVEVLGRDECRALGGLVQRNAPTGSEGPAARQRGRGGGSRRLLLRRNVLRFIVNESLRVNFSRACTPLELLTSITRIPSRIEVCDAGVCDYPSRSC